MKIEQDDSAQLRRVWQRRQRPLRAAPIANRVMQFMQRVVYPRHRRLLLLGQAWRELLPAELVSHSCLEDVQRGQLRVLVDSASHMYELRLLVEEGLTERLQELCPVAGISQVKLVRGCWYRRGERGEEIPEYSAAGQRC